MKTYFLGAVISAISLVGCAKTAITPISQNQFLLSTSAAPACGASGAAKVVSQMAAVETLRRGYDRFVILGAGSQNNVSVVNNGPTYASTSSRYSAYGNQVYGNSTTTFGGGGPNIVGTRDASLMVLTLKKGDKDYGQGIDAKQALGPEWEEKVSKGISTCAS